MDGTEPLELQQIRGFLETRKALVADPNSSNRKATLKILSELGVIGGRLLYAANLSDAVDVFRHEKPTIIITEYQLETGCGLDLTPEIRQVYPDRSETLFVILAGRNLGVVKSHVHESDADGLITKPYSADSFLKALHDMIAEKLAPTAFTHRLEVGRAFLARGELEPAIASFIQAHELLPKNAEALAFLGVARFRAGRIPEAYRTLSEGLKADGRNYRCMHGMLDLLIHENRIKEAHAMAMAIFSVHPLNPQRIPQLVRLAVSAGAFADLFKYAEVYETLDDKSPELARVLANGLFLAGKDFLGKGNADKGIQAFLKAEVAAPGELELKRQMVCELVRHGHRKEAEGMKGRLPEDISDDPAYREACIHEAILVKDMPRALQLALDLIRDGSRSAFVFSSAIELSIRTKRRESAVDDLLYRAIAALPEEKGAFEELVRKARNSGA